MSLFNDKDKDKEDHTNPNFSNSNILELVFASLYNEPSSGLFYTQQHIHNSFPILLSNMDNLYENRKRLDRIIKNIEVASQEIEEVVSLNDDFSFKMLTKLSAINYKLSLKKYTYYIILYYIIFNSLIFLFDTFLLSSLYSPMDDYLEISLLYLLLHFLLGLIIHLDDNLYSLLYYILFHVE